MVVSQIHPPNIISDEPVNCITPDEYRAREEIAEERHEYNNGEITIVSGGTETHSAIATNILIHLGFVLRDTDFRLYNSDLRIWIPQFNCGTYADIFVIEGEPEFNENRRDEILNPRLIVEVLSSSTEGYDRGEKFRKYRSLPGFCEYLLVNQNEPYVERYYNSDRENENRWQWQVCDRLEEEIVLQSLNNLELPMREIYRRIEF